jgi:glycosyltransferase involved in cell wall biosynthesis
LIVSFGPEIFETQNFGGVSRYFFELYKNLSERNLSKVYFLGALHRNFYLQEVSNNSVLSMYYSYPSISLPVIRILNKKISEKQLMEINPRIHHQTFYRKDLLGKNYKGARVLTVFDLINEKYQEFFKRNEFQLHAKRQSIYSADHIICISDSTKNDLLEVYNIQESRVSVVHLGSSLLNQDLADSSQRDYCIEYPFLKEPFLLYIGGRRGYKNFNIVLESYAKSNKVSSLMRVVCFGGGPVSKVDIKIIKDLKIDRSKIHFISGSDQLLIFLYKKAIALIYPSLFEGFGLPPLEAMSLGCPIILSNTSSLPEVAGEAGLYFDPLSVDELVFILEEMIHGNQSLLTKRLIGVERSKKFTWESTAINTMNVYKSI